MTAIVQNFKGKTHVSLGVQPYVPGGVASWKIPQDIVAKEFIIVAEGTISSVFGGTAPKVRPYGVLDGLIADMSLSRKGTDRVRSYNGTRQLVQTQERQFGTMEGCIYKVNGSDLSGTTLQASIPTLGTTGQSTAFRESQTMMLENKLSGTWYPTLFNTKGLQTATLNMSFAAAANIQDPEDATSVTSWSASVNIEVFASCADFLLDSPDLNKADWNQTYEEKEFSGVQKNARHYITPQGMVQGILITGMYGGNGKLFDFNNMKNTRIELRYMGIQLAEGALSDFLEIDINKTALTYRRKGSAYLSFLNNGQFDSGLFIAEGKQLELIISTDSAMSYAQPVKLRFEYDQIIFPVAPQKAA